MRKADHLCLACGRSTETGHYVQGGIALRLMRTDAGGDGAAACTLGYLEVGCVGGPVRELGASVPRPVVGWSARAGRWRDAEVLTDLSGERVGDLAGDGGRPGGVDTPVAVPPSFSQQAGAVRAQVALEVATLHAAMTSSSDSLSVAGSVKACSPKRSSRMP